MIYTDAKYINDYVTGKPVWINVNIQGVNSWVSIDPANTDYQNIMKLVEDGELTIAPAEEPTE